MPVQQGFCGRYHSMAQGPIPANAKQALRGMELPGKSWPPAACLRGRESWCLRSLLWYVVHACAIECWKLTLALINKMCSVEEGTPTMMDLKISAPDMSLNPSAPSHAEMSPKTAPTRKYRTRTMGGHCKNKYLNIYQPQRSTRFC